MFKKTSSLLKTEGSSATYAGVAAAAAVVVVVAVVNVCVLVETVVVGIVGILLVDIFGKIELVTNAVTKVT